MEDIVRQLTEVYGPSGIEERVRGLIEGLLAGVVDEVRTDTMGNLITVKRATTGQSAGKLMFAAHMDEIGLIVSYIDEKGFARFQTLGGVSATTLVGSRAVFAGGVVGVIGWEKWLSGDNAPSMDKLYIDVGASSRETSPVHVGDVAGFSRPFVAQGQRWVAKSMDDRIGCAVLVQFLREVQETAYDIYGVFTAQEEVGTRGATITGYGVAPDIGIAVDVTTTGDTPEAAKMAVELGKGPAIKVKDSGMIAHPRLREAMEEVASAAGIPYQLEVLAGGSTDARSIQLSRAGVPAGVISIPCRYVHTPSEMVDQGDVRGAVDLMLRLVAAPIRLTPAS